MRTLFVFWIALASVWAGIAQAQTVRKATPAASTATAPAAEPKAPGAEDVPLRTGDVFELRLTGMPAEEAMPFAQQFTIGGDGMVNIPIAGRLRAGGLTQSQLERAIEKLLIDEKIFTHPTANINVAPQSRVVTVGGQVRAPQRMLWTPDLTLTAAISVAGGAADFAGAKIKLTRGGVVTIFNKKDLDRKPGSDPRLMPGDRVDHL